MGKYDHTNISKAVQIVIKLVSYYKLINFYINTNSKFDQDLKVGHIEATFSCHF